MTREEPMKLSFGAVYLVEEMTQEEILAKKQLGLFDEDKRGVPELCTPEGEN